MRHRKVASPAGAWIETVNIIKFGYLLWSRLPQARGLKLVWGSKEEKQGLSRLPQARGLKQESMDAGEQLQRSRLPQARGLKHITPDGYLVKRRRVSRRRVD